MFFAKPIIEQKLPLLSYKNFQNLQHHLTPVWRGHSFFKVFSFPHVCGLFWKTQVAPDHTANPKAAQRLHQRPSEAWLPSFLPFLFLLFLSILLEILVPITTKSSWVLLPQEVEWWGRGSPALTVRQLWVSVLQLRARERGANNPGQPLSLCFCMRQKTTTSWVCCWNEMKVTNPVVKTWHMLDKCWFSFFVNKNDALTAFSPKSITQKA